MGEKCARAPPPCLSPASARFLLFLLLNDFPPPSRSLEQATSHEAIEDVQVVEEAEGEEEDEYDTDSDAEYPIADNYEVDSLDDLLFLRVVTKRSGRMVRVVHRE